MAKKVVTLREKIEGRSRKVYICEGCGAELSKWNSGLIFQGNIYSLPTEEATEMLEPYQECFPDNKVRFTRDDVNIFILCNRCICKKFDIIPETVEED